MYGLHGVIPLLLIWVGAVVVIYGLLNLTSENEVYHRGGGFGFGVGVLILMAGCMMNGNGNPINVMPSSGTYRVLEPESKIIVLQELGTRKGFAIGTPPVPMCFEVPKEKFAIIKVSPSAPNAGMAVVDNYDYNQMVTYYEIDQTLADPLPEVKKPTQPVAGPFKESLPVRPVQKSP
ncbi:MAG: hypothetical protein WCI57_00155 [Candidatus Berkelbacteria bacterium]